jgi:hypothetical protein
MIELIATGIERLRFEVRSRLSSRPRLFPAVLRHRRRYRGLLPDARTEIVIEGFPRSGNTFAYAALAVAQGRPVRAARHTHAPSILRRAVELRLPVLLLVRRPRDAVLSLLTYEPRISPAQAVSAYLRFYDAVRPIDLGYVVATFEQVTSDFGGVIDRLNSRFGTGFERFIPTEENVARAMRTVEELARKEGGGKLDETRVARPSVPRRALNEELAPLLESARITSLLARADQIYGDVAALAERT